ncbi:MAG TPA: hypothetical protein VFB36_15240 [Nevskiaceae bacterium]|nr:hypothetical protein [Nevskiaceae bacterium]
MKSLPLLAALSVFFLAPLAHAEPYLAVREGFKCMQCHVNPTGGGMRTVFGNAYAQSKLAAERIDTDAYGQWADAMKNMITLGGDLRADYSYVDVPHGKSSNAFSTEDMRVYVAANVIPDHLIIYADQSLGPGGSENREAYARLMFDEGRYYLKGGHMYLPYGIRLQDDSAFIRDVSGINYETPDNGVELGLELPSWTAQLAVSNGNAGASEQDDGKQYSLRAEFVQAMWRLGASANYNDAAGGRRKMGNVFAGLRTGPIAWLAEADYIVDDGFATGRRRLWTGLLEGDWEWRQGHNVKITGELYDPDTKVHNDQNARWSAVYEWTPIQFLQVRGGLRYYDGIPQNDLQNRRVGFVELHGFF